MGVRLRAFVVVLAGVIVGGLGGLGATSTAGAAGSAVHAITVTPSTGLSDGQTVVVSGTGFTEAPAVNDWSVAECRAKILDQAITLNTALDNCDVTSQPFVFVHADSAGNLSTSYTAHATFTLTTGGVGTVDCTATQCALLVAEIINGGQGFVGAAALVTFGGAPPPSPPPSPWFARRPLNIAHAGGDLESPHETMFAYKQAVAAGADMLEMDLRLSKDHQLMVIHDDTLDRTTNATGPVRDRTAAELGALDNAYWFVPNCWSCHDRPVDDYLLRGARTGARPVPAGYAAADFGIPTFQQVLDQFPDRILDVEIKDGPDGMAAAEALASVLNGSPHADRVVVVSFDDTILDHFHTLAPLVATSPGLTATTNWFVGTRGALPTRVSLQVPPVYSGIDVVSQKFVDDAHAVHLAVWVWFNGNDDDVASEWNRLLDLGVDGLITGKPRQLQAVLDGRAASFAPPLDVVTELRVRHHRARVEVTCSPLTADRCVALLAVRSGASIVGGVSVDLAPGEHRWLQISGGRRSWSRLARSGLTYQIWAGPDTASSTGPLAVRT